MMEADDACILGELDRLLNDPDVPLQPARVWALLDEMARRDLAHGGATANVSLAARSTISEELFPHGF